MINPTGESGAKTAERAPDPVPVGPSLARLQSRVQDRQAVAEPVRKASHQGGSETDLRDKDQDTPPHLQSDRRRPDVDLRLAGAGHPVQQEVPPGRRSHGRGDRLDGRLLLGHQGKRLGALEHRQTGDCGGNLWPRFPGHHRARHQRVDRGGPDPFPRERGQRHAPPEPAQAPEGLRLRRRPEHPRQCLLQVGGLDGEDRHPLARAAGRGRFPDGTQSRRKHRADDLADGSDVVIRGEADQFQERGRQEREVIHHRLHLPHPDPGIGGSGRLSQDHAGQAAAAEGHAHPLARVRRALRLGPQIGEGAPERDRHRDLHATGQVPLPGLRWRQPGRAAPSPGGDRRRRPGGSPECTGVAGRPDETSASRESPRSSAGGPVPW